MIKTKMATTFNCKPAISRGVWNPMKMSDITFLKTEPTSKFKNQKLGFRGSVFKKTDIRGFGTVFHVVLFTIHLPT